MTYPLNKFDFVSSITEEYPPLEGLRDILNDLEKANLFAEQCELRDAQILIKAAISRVKTETVELFY